MQYIGRIFSSAKRMYSDINSATLNGAIDVLVIKYPNGDIVSSPFYVQFGKTGVFRPCADEVSFFHFGFSPKVESAYWCAYLIRSF